MCKNFALSKNKAPVLYGQSTLGVSASIELAPITRAKRRPLQSYQVYFGYDTGDRTNVHDSLKRIPIVYKHSTTLFLDPTESISVRLLRSLATVSRAIFRVEFRRNHRTNTTPTGASGENPRWEIRKRFPCDFLSYENDIQRVARRAVVWNSAVDPEYAENPAKHTHIRNKPILHGGRSALTYFFLFLIF